MLKLMYSSKTSQDYILLSTFERKTTFSAIYKPKVRETACFWPFLYISGSVEGLFNFSDSLCHHPRAGHSTRP
jgi:hypothetical protein